MRLLLAALAATLSITGVALAAGDTINVRQAGSSSQSGRPVTLRIRGPVDPVQAGRPQKVTSYTIQWKAFCAGGVSYIGSTVLHNMVVRRDGRFAGRLSYSHPLTGGGTAHVAVRVAGRFNSARSATTRGFWHGQARLSGIGTCTTGTVRWHTRAAD